MNPFRPFLDRQGVVVLDGGLATELEAQGHDLEDPLWSAKILLESPEAVRRVHRAYLEAGADCIATVTYQATLQGFGRRGYTATEAEELLREAVRLATSERDAFWRNRAQRAGRLRPLVAASVGPYGAFLADGSEYSGRYGLNEAELRAFHAPRWRILAGSEADLLACETIPSGPEVRALLGLLRETPERWAWISFSCGDDAHLWDGTPVTEAAAACDAEERVAAVGVNCVRPELVEALVTRLRAATDKPVVVYPNSGDVYDAVRRAWVPGPTTSIPSAHATVWVARGARVVGGCCHIGPAGIRDLRRAVLRAAGRHTPP